MHAKQAFSLLPLFLLTPLTLAAPYAEALAEPQGTPPVCAVSKTPFDCSYPDLYMPGPGNFRGFTGPFIGKGFPWYLDSPQGRVCPGRVEDTVRRGIQVPQVAESAYDYVNGVKHGDPRDVQRCADARTPIFQGTTYVGNQQIFLTYNPIPAGDNPTNQEVHYCGYSSPFYDSLEQFFPGCDIPIPQTA